MKLIIQIPCFNEEETLPITLAALPRQLEGIDKVEWLIIDDGCTDRTVEVAKVNGVDHIVPHMKNMGLAKAFLTGLRSCVEHGADIIVNTDADNQYDASSIPDLIQPILDGKAEFVIGARPIDKMEQFSSIKKLFQKMGSWVVRMASGTDIPDAPSGFRAMSRDMAMQMNLFTKYTYTLESIIQAGQKGIPITWVPIKTNKDLRPSRLVKSIPSYMYRSANVIARIFVIYRPFKVFSYIGIGLFCLGLLISFRFLWFYFTGNGQGHIQSLLLSGVLLSLGFQVIMVAFLADLLSVNRRLSEEVLLKSRLIEMKINSDENQGSS